MSGSVVTAERALVMAGWDDVPHLSDDEKERQRKLILPSQLDARERGIPLIGAGAIYPIRDDELVVDPFEIPGHFARGYGFDPGWRWTAAIFGAWDRDADVLYLTAEHKRAHAEPPSHAAAVQALGPPWLLGASDPAIVGSSQRDGEKLLAEYNALGLTLIRADNAVEAGLQAVWIRMVTGRLRVFRGLSQWFAEKALYRRDEKGRIVKDNDHLMDATRYLVTMLAAVMQTEVSPKQGPARRSRGPHGWMRQ